MGPLCTDADLVHRESNGDDAVGGVKLPRTLRELEKLHSLK